MVEAREVSHPSTVQLGEGSWVWAGSGAGERTTSTPVTCIFPLLSRGEAGGQCSRPEPTGQERGAFGSAARTAPHSKPGLPQRGSTEPLRRPRPQRQLFPAAGL